MSSSKYERPPAVVVALNNLNGLGTVRALGHMGIPVIAVVPRREVPAEHTKYCLRRIRLDLLDKESVMQAIVEIGRSLPAKSVIFPSGDFFLTVLSENRDVLEEYYYFPFAQAEKVRLISDKVAFYKFATARGLPISPTYFPECSADVARIAGAINYPCLIKPSTATVAWRKAGLKILAANSPSELLEKYERAVRIQPDVVIQEVTPGPDSALHFSITYVDRNGQIPAMFTGRKLRQYRPRYGISSMAQSLWLPEIADLTRRILSELDYTGYASIEFKKHPATGEYLMTEVTGRTWYPHALTERCGMNFPYMIYCDLVEGRIPDSTPSTFQQGVKWIDEVGDLKSAFQYWREGGLSIVEWLRSYRGKKAWGLAARNDPGPMFALAGDLLLRLPGALGRRLARGARALIRPADSARKGS